jgi:putative molybdopterin biosynthesis protein
VAARQTGAAVRLWSKLLFAEQRAKARALRELEKLLADMEREFALAFDPATPISVSASKLQLPTLA